MLLLRFFFRNISYSINNLVLGLKFLHEAVICNIIHYKYYNVYKKLYKIYVTYHACSFQKLFIFLNIIKPIKMFIIKEKTIFLYLFNVIRECEYQMFLESIQQFTIFFILLITYLMYGK